MAAAKVPSDWRLATSEEERLGFYLYGQVRVFRENLEEEVVQKGQDEALC